MADSPRPLLNVAAGDAHLGRILRKAQHLLALEAQVSAALPPEFAGQVKVADLRDGTLVLGAATPAVAARLRYAGPDVLKALAGACSPPPQRVRVRILRDG